MPEPLSPHDPAQHDPAQRDPAPADPAQHDPAPHDPARADPARTDPGQLDGGSSDLGGFELVGRSVRLEPLAARHAESLAAAAAGDRSTYDYTVVPDGVDAAAAYIDHLLAERRAGTSVPFVQQRLGAATPTLVGCTRFMNIRRWSRHGDPDEVEIGGTWLAPAAQRTPVNTEAKLLLLTHAFEVWNVWRVDFATDARNERSRAALARLGATFEGVLRNHRPASDSDSRERRPRDSALYSITSQEWPTVGRRLRERLES